MSTIASRLFRGAVIAGAGLAALALVHCGGSSTIVPAGPHTHYVANKVLVPVNNTEAREYGLDLNGDGTVDNQLGMVLGTLAGMGFDIQGTIDKAVAEGSVTLLVDYQGTDFTNSAKSGLAILLGQNPQPAACSGSADVYACKTAAGSACTAGSGGCTCSGCMHQLAGNASFDLAAGQMLQQLPGPTVNGTFNGGPGEITLQIALASAMPITLDLIGARAQASMISATAIGMTAGGPAGTMSTGGAILAGALTQDDLNNKVIPAIQQQLVPIIARDCTMLSNPPTCGCADGSTGKTILGLFDTNHDCMVSVIEIQTNSLIMSLLAPDVTINGKPALSLGIKVTAVGATFTNP